MASGLRLPPLAIAPSAFAPGSSVFWVTSSESLLMASMRSAKPAVQPGAIVADPVNEKFVPIETAPVSVM